MQALDALKNQYMSEPDAEPMDPREWEKSVLAKPDKSWGAGDYANAVMGHNKNLPDDINQQIANKNAEDYAGFGIGTIGKASAKDVLKKIMP
jgi:hypothetical protein